MNQQIIELENSDSDNSIVDFSSEGEQEESRMEELGDLKIPEIQEIQNINLEIPQLCQKKTIKNKNHRRECDWRAMFSVFKDLKQLTMKSSSNIPKLKSIDQSLYSLVNSTISAFQRIQKK